MDDHRGSRFKMEDEVSKKEWLSNRRYAPSGGYRITASDVGAILGWDPRRTALNVCENKINGSETPDNDDMMAGRCLEPGIADFYEKKTGRLVRNPGDTFMNVHPDFDWLAATPDRFTWEIGEEESQGSPLEIKHARSKKWREWQDGAPLWVQIQVQTQIACAVAPWGAYCGFVGGAPFMGDIERNDGFIDSTLLILDDFILRLNAGILPDVTAPRDLTPIKKLYPHDNGETIMLTADDKDLADGWQQAKEDRKKSEDEREMKEAKLRAKIGGATFGSLPDGTILSLKTTVRKDGVTYRTLRRMSE